jgi:hypothetical protein
MTDMTNLNNDTCELTMDELDIVSGSISFSIGGFGLGISDTGVTIFAKGVGTMVITGSGVCVETPKTGITCTSA